PGPDRGDDRRLSPCRPARMMAYPETADRLWARAEPASGSEHGQDQGPTTSLETAAVINQTLVSAADPAFGSPTKFVGPVYDEQTARRLQTERGWQVAPDGRYWRRVVPSPMPQ